MKRGESIRAPAKLESLKMLREHAAACARRFGCSPSRTREIELAVEEALVNIFAYAYPEGTGVDVEISCSEAEESLLIEICDSGVQFNPVAFPSPVLAGSVAERAIGGMGIPILRRYADDIAYTRAGDRNVLTICFTRKNADE